MIEIVVKPKAVAAEAAYKTTAITTQDRVQKKGFFRKHEYVYDEHFNCYLCTAGEVLKYSTATKEGYREYKSPKHICATCPFLASMYRK